MESKKNKFTNLRKIGDMLVTCLAISGILLSFSLILYLLTRAFS